MKAKRILFVTQEINPYVPESALTWLGRAVPVAAIEDGREIRTFMPKWGNINERRNQLHEVIRLSGLTTTIDQSDHSLLIKVASVTNTRMQIYFIDNDDLFGKRLAERNADGTEPTDNTQRMAFYARCVLETVKKLRWVPEVVHCQGWVAGLVPLYIKAAFADDPALRNCRVVYTISPTPLTRNTGPRLANIIDYRGAGAECIADLGDDLTPVQMQKLAIKYSDAVTFANASPELVAYAQSMGKTIMPQGKETAADYLQFFDNVWGKDKTIAE